MKICIDFDGTCVAHDYPNIGKDIGSIPVLKKIVEDGHYLILFTMRSGKGLAEAVEWFNENGIELYGVNTDPEQKSWTDSPKAYGHLYIDDAALGCPLIINYSVSNRPYVDWPTVKNLLEMKGIIEYESE